MAQSTDFTVREMQAIATRLDEEERALGLEERGNANIWGDYNIQVLEEAVGRRDHKLVRCGPTLSIADAINNGEPILVNHHSHWRALRREQGQWWDLDSCLENRRHYPIASC